MLFVFRPTHFIAFLLLASSSMLLISPAQGQFQHRWQPRGPRAVRDEDEPAPTTRRATVNENAPLTQQCDETIRRGVQFLLSRQTEAGSWTGQRAEDLDVGRTSLICLALISAGESPQSPPLASAIRYLKKAQVNGVHQTYCVAMRAAFYSQLPEPLRRTELPADVARLRGMMIERGPSAGMYTYSRSLRDVVQGDYSNSQYGVLGVWYAALAGVEVPNTYWRMVEAGWRNGQADDGGWGYTVSWGSPYASMTAAGAATLYITNDYLHTAEELNLEKRHENPPLEKAMAWLGRNFAVNGNAGKNFPLMPPRGGVVKQEQQDRRSAPADRDDGDEIADMIGALMGKDSKDAKPQAATTQKQDENVNEIPAENPEPNAEPEGTYLHYLLWSYERVGEASGLTRFGGHEWFDEGARYLIHTQYDDGSWEGSLSRDIDSAYALLFLSRGRAPVAMQKLQWPGRWNNRSRDVATAVHWIARQTERHTNWQIVTPESTAAELRQAPILYVSGDKPLELTSDVVAKIKTFIEQGGLLLAVNEGTQRKDFATSVEAMGREMFRGAYAFRDLPADHPLFTENFPTDGLQTPARGLSNGVRELIVLIPSGDMSWRWQAGPGTKDAAKAPAFGLAGNLWLYVTDKSIPRYKGEDAWVEASPAIQSRQQINVMRVQFAGNWNPEPAGWQRLANILHNNDAIDLRVINVPVASLRPSSGAIAHMTCTGPFALQQAEAAWLKRYLDGGGLLVFDAAGGSVDATASFEALLAGLYPNAKLAPLPPDHPIYAAQGNGGKPIQFVTYRRTAYSRLPKDAAQLPRLRGLTLNGRLAVVESDEDLSAGLVGYSTDGVAGYAPDSATALMRNILLSRVPAH